MLHQDLLFVGVDEIGVLHQDLLFVGVDEMGVLHQALLSAGVNGMGVLHQALLSASVNLENPGMNPIVAVSNFGQFRSLHVAQFTQLYK